MGRVPETHGPGRATVQFAGFARSQLRAARRLLLGRSRGLDRRPRTAAAPGSCPPPAGFGRGDHGRPGTRSGLAAWRNGVRTWGERGCPCWEEGCPMDPVSIDFEGWGSPPNPVALWLRGSRCPSNRSPLFRGAEGLEFEGCHHPSNQGAIGPLGTTARVRGMPLSLESRRDRTARHDDSDSRDAIVPRANARSYRGA
jgi:hypothetical protein